MTQSQDEIKEENSKICIKVVISTFIFVLLSTFSIFSQSNRKPVKKGEPQRYRTEAPSDSTLIKYMHSYDSDIADVFADSIVPIDTISDNYAYIIPPLPDSVIEEWEVRDIAFNPDPTKAVWLSALFPGLGQIYNRRYWKLPILTGGFMGLGYATTWNNGMLNDYSQAYLDIMDSDPSTNSYMDFFPNNTEESSIDKKWLTNVLKSRKDYYRRNRDLCIISMVGVYLIAMVDAYVDASLSHFDISPDLSIDVAPAIFKDTHDKYPSLGINWAINF